MEGRSGDLFMVPRRDWIIEQRADGDATTHGTMHEYDRRVPLLIAGAGFAAGADIGNREPSRHRADAGRRGRRQTAGSRRPVAAQAPARRVERVRGPATGGLGCGNVGSSRNTSAS